MDIQFQAIGIIHTPFTSLEGMPVQPTGAAGVQGHIDLNPELADGLNDIDGFSHLILLFHFHRSKGFNLSVTPFFDRRSRGLFSTRAPKRPNAIGLSIVHLLRREEHRLYIENADILDGTPLLDIKPYVPHFDAYPDARIGWLEQAKPQFDTKRSDDRFQS